MKIGILSYGSESNLRLRYIPRNEKLLVASAKAKGHEVVVYKSSKFEMFYSNKKNDLFYAGKRFKGVDVMIPRPSLSVDIDLEMTLNKHFLLMGVPLVNGYMPVLRAKNKIRTMQILGHEGIPVPRTVILKSLKYMDSAVKRVGGYPVIVKAPVGSFGKGVVIVESRRSLLSSLDVLWMQGGSKSFLIQEYVEEANGCDVRVFVVGGKVVAAMLRSAAVGDFRSNIKLGGKGSLVDLAPEEERLSIAAADVLGLDVAGVDVLRTKNGPVIMEVNANPGLSGIVGVTNIDVPGAIIDFAVSRAEKNIENVHTGVVQRIDIKMDEPHSVV